MNQDFFIKMLQSKQFIDFSNNVNKGSYDDIDWFNLENEIEEICIKDGVSYDKFHRLYEHMLEKRFSEIRKYVVQPKEINIIFEKILNELVDNLDILTPVSDFYNANYEIESSIKNQVTKSINYLNAYNVIEKPSKSNGLGVQYKTNSDFWHKKVDGYIINSTELLKELVPIIISYIKNGNIKTYNIQILFYKFSKIIEYAIIPALEHNPLLDIEFQIQNACENKEEIEVLYNGKLEEINPIKIVIKNDNKKYVQIKNDGKFAYIPLNEIEIDFEYQIKDESIFDKNLSVDLINNSDINIDVILECESVTYEYFQMKPLRNIKLFDTEEKQEEFHQTFEIKPQDNKFYIVAQDNEDMILSTVLHTLPHAKILKPSSLNDKLISKFKTYAEGIDYDMCDDETPPSEPNEPFDEDSNLENENELKRKNNRVSNKKDKSKISKFNEDDSSSLGF